MVGIPCNTGNGDEGLAWRYGCIVEPCTEGAFSEPACLKLPCGKVACGACTSGFTGGTCIAFLLTSTRTTVHPLCLCENASVSSSPGRSSLSAENLPQPPLSMHEYCRRSTLTGQYLPWRASSRVAFSFCTAPHGTKCGIIHLLGMVSVVLGPAAEGGSTLTRGSAGSELPRKGYR
eukprot:scaffold73_cov337-Pavlova_lutheri.AAC.58